MMGMRVAVFQFSFQSAICCRIPLAAMCRVFQVHLSKKHDVSSMAKISSGESERLYSLMSRASNSNQWLTVCSLSAPPRTVVSDVDQYIERLSQFLLSIFQTQFVPSSADGSSLMSQRICIARLSALLAVSGNPCSAVCSESSGKVGR